MRVIKKWDEKTEKKTALRCFPIKSTRENIRRTQRFYHNSSCVRSCVLKTLITFLLDKFCCPATHTCLLVALGSDRETVVSEKQFVHPNSWYKTTQELHFNPEGLA